MGDGGVKKLDCLQKERLPMKINRFHSSGWPADESSPAAAGLKVFPWHARWSCTKKQCTPINGASSNEGWNCRGSMLRTVLKGLANAGEDKRGRHRDLEQNLQHACGSISGFMCHGSTFEIAQWRKPLAERTDLYLDILPLAIHDSKEIKLYKFATNWGHKSFNAHYQWHCARSHHRWSDHNIIRNGSPGIMIIIFIIDKDRLPICLNCSHCLDNGNAKCTKSIDVYDIDIHQNLKKYSNPVTSGRVQNSPNTECCRVIRSIMRSMWNAVPADTWRKQTISDANTASRQAVGFREIFLRILFTQIVQALKSFRKRNSARRVTRWQRAPFLRLGKVSVALWYRSVLELA